MIVSGGKDSLFGQVVLQTDHADLAHQMAVAFGNSHFEDLEPRELMEFLVLHHDRGWDETDLTIKRNPQTGLPFSLVQTPMNELLLTGPRSVEFNAAHHPYCGLLCCMHIWGLFNGRYGLSDKLVVNVLEGEAKLNALAMLEAIQKRQAELRKDLQELTAFAPFLAEPKLMQNYKALQFFDTLSLYFNESAAKEKQVAVFLNVPRTEFEATNLELTPLGENRFRLSPYPFKKDGLQLQHKVFDIPLMNKDVEYSQVFQNSNWRYETITLVS
ncbi:MAG: DUF3891 family protein [Proteobacteria bacterium]|nr:DUF3891 family protein [Pseudomonadota bacterium]